MSNVAQVERIFSADENELSELLAVYQSAGWWDTETEDYRQISTIISRSYCFAVIRIEEKIVGMARTISDGISDAYIQDVAILPEYQGLGYGKLLVDFLVEFLTDKQISWIGLIATPGAETFYRKSGFTAMENFTPMLYKKEDRDVV